MIEAVMFGELNIKPWELYRMTFRDVTLAIEGYNNARDYQYSLHYRSALITAASGMNAKAAVSRFHKIFPITNKGDGGSSISPEVRARLQKLRNRYAIESKKQLTNV